MTDGVPAAERFDRRRGGEERGWKVARELAPHVTAGPVVEVGTGTGLIASGLQELGFPAIGVDIDVDLLTRAYDRLGPRVLQGDALALPLGSGSVATAVYVHLLHLLADLRHGLAEVARVLRPGGRLLAVHGVPTADLGDMTAAFAPLKPLSYLPDEPHLLDPVAVGCGLALVYRGTTSGYEGGMTPNDYAASIEMKVWSYLSDLDPDTWRSAVEPVVAGLRALPDPDRARMLSWRVHFSVYARQ